jgi:hypothetical protein
MELLYDSVYCSNELSINKKSNNIKIIKYLVAYYVYSLLNNILYIGKLIVYISCLYH